MFRKELKWWFPESMEEAASLLQGRKVVPHAGGTALLRVKLRRLEGLVDLARLKLGYLEREGEKIHLGAMLTFSEIIAAGTGEPWQEFLAGALSACAATPLRHRITLGGSIADAPPWSDLLPPLLCLQAEVDLWEKEGRSKRMRLERYLKEKNQLAPHLIREVIVDPAGSLVFATKRLAMVSFDYAACHLAMCARAEGGCLHDPRLYVSGTGGRVTRLKEVESFLADNPVEEGLAAEAAEQVRAKFPRDFRFSADYKLHWTRVKVKEGVLEMGRASS